MTTMTAPTTTAPAAEYHDCGGIIEGRGDHDMCDHCGAYAPAGDELPSGTDIDANEAAYDAGEERSPDTDAEGELDDE